MSTMLHPSPASGFIVASFLEATHVTDFHQRWMSVDTWAELIKHHYSLNDSLSFTGNQLLKALSSKQHRHLFTLMDADQSSVPKDHISIFHDKYWPQTSAKHIYCFYATLKGNKPFNKPWFENVDLALDLSNTHQTWRQHKQQQLKKTTLILQAPCKINLHQRNESTSPKLENCCLWAPCHQKEVMLLHHSQTHSQTHSHHQVHHWVHDQVCDHPLQLLCTGNHLKWRSCLIWNRVRQW